jgi:hypothetical protein
MTERDINAGMIKRHIEEQVFYGWFDDPQSDPTYSPPLGGPCPLCGKIITLLVNDVSTHSLMYHGSYAKRSYFYRTHKSCAERDATQTAADGFILDMIARNGD